MFNFAKKAALALALGASALASATPAMADPYYGGYRHHEHGGDGAGAAIAGGLIGLALGAIIVSSSNHHRDRDYNERRYDSRYRGQPSWNGGYYNNGYNGGYNNGYRGGYQQGAGRDGYPQGNDGGYYERRGYRDNYDGGNDSRRNNDTDNREQDNRGSDYRGN
jgi:hypothetical protein